jgi:hypothetical protein
MLREFTVYKWLAFIIFVTILSAVTIGIANAQTEGLDKFGIKKIYPTKPGGREWFVNTSNPKNDSLFSITFNPDIKKQADSSWHISYPKVRMNVNTPTGAEQWKNVEVTGYAKVLTVNSSNLRTIQSADDDYLNDLAWYARGGKHNNRMPCEGTALVGGIHTDGTVGWKKIIWFTGGYTSERDNAKVTDSILGRWIGWKVVMYNVLNGSTVKMESYLDYNNNNKWIKVTDLIDNGGWYANTSDDIFNSAKCARSKDYIVSNPGPIVTFRSDNISWDFKNLSIREIQPP